MRNSEKYIGKENKTSDRVDGDPPVTLSFLGYGPLASLCLRENILPGENCTRGFLTVKMQTRCALEPGFLPGDQS